MTQNFPSLSKSPMAHTASGDEDVIDVGQVLGILWRGKFIIAAAAFLCAVMGAYYSIGIATPIYRSTSVVMLETQPAQIVDIESVVGGLSGESTELNSEVEVLRSRGLMGKVVEELNLREDPEFNRNLTPPSRVSELKSWIKEAFGRPKATEPEAEQALRMETDQVTASLLDAVSVRNIPQSFVFEITASSESAVKAALIADTIADLYIENQIAVKFEATEKATVWLTDQVATLKQELEVAESRVAEFNAQTDLISLEDLQAQERQMKDLRDRIVNANVSAAAARQRLEALEEVMNDTRSAKVTAAQDSQLDRLFSGLPTDPTVEQARGFDQRFAFLLDQAQTNLTRATQQAGALEAAAVRLEAQNAQQSDDLIALQQLTREAEASRLLYEYFLGRLKETAAQQGIQQADSRVLSNAVIPAYASEPRAGVTIALTAVVGLFIGSLVVMLMEARAQTFRTAADLEQTTGYTVMGQLPMVPVRRRKDVIQYLADRPTSAAAEAVRNLRTSIMLSDFDTPPQVILTTSSLPGEGKTTVSLSLAQNFIGMGKKVLLVEGDIRRRVFGQYLNTDQKQGLVAVIKGEAKLEDCVINDPRVKADILIGEETKVNAADLFSSSAFGDFIAKAREQYDIIIIDTPPVLVVPDARIIAKHVDAVLFGVKWDSTSKTQVQDALRMFESVGQKVSGLVLGQVSPDGMKRYGYGGRYGSYAAYGAKYYNN